MLLQGIPLQSIPYFDAHCDTLSAAMQRGVPLYQNDLHLDLRRLAAYAPSAQIFALFLRPQGWDFSNGNYTEDCPYEALRPAFEALLDYALRAFEENSHRVTLCRSAAEARETFAQGKVAAFLAVEGAEQIGCDEETLIAAFARGVRFVNLSWNYPNALCGTNQVGGGLTEKGRSFVRKAQMLGIAVDLSHASDAAFYDCLEIAEKPILAGHSNARALCNHPRNLTDDMFRALVRTGGVAGLNLCPDFLGEDADMGTAIRHIEHFLSLGGEKAVCLGTDFDGIPAPPRGIAGVEDMSVLYNELLRLNYPESLVRAIFFDNLMDYLDRAL